MTCGNLKLMMIDGFYFFAEDIRKEEAMIDLYHEILKRVENSITDVVQYASVSLHTINR